MKKIMVPRKKKTTTAAPSVRRAAAGSEVRVTRRPAPRARRAAAPPAPPGEALQAIRALHALVQSRLPEPVHGERALEDSVDSLRRLLSELIEARTESVARDVAALRGLAVKTKSEQGIVDAIDALLARLGAIRFEARRLDFVDPLIHRVVAERADAGAADGVIVSAMQPGYKTARGIVLARADVIVNRRD